MFIRKILVAGLAVAGIVGMASAQAPSPITPNGLQNPPTGTMEVSYSVNLEADMVVTSTGLSGNALLNDPCATTSHGNIGTVNVKTNYPFWDVLVKAENGGYLALPGTVTIIPPTVPGGNSTTQNDPGKPLLASGAWTATTPDTARIQACVGLVDVGAGAWVSGTALLDTIFSKLKPLATTKDASFAKTIGEKLATGKYNGQTGGPTATAGSIAAAGFVTPAAPAVNLDNGVMFYLSAGLTNNAGVLIPATTGIKGQNDEGDYTETLTFTLVASF